VAVGEKAKKLTVKASLSGGQYGTALVTVLGNAEDHSVVNNGVLVSPQMISVEKGKSVEFKACNGVDGSTITSGVSWDVFSAVSGTKISAAGKLYVAVDEGYERLTVRAKTKDGIYGTAVVKVTANSGNEGGNNFILTTVAEIENYLKTATVGTDAGNPVSLSVGLNLSDTSGNGLINLLSAIQTAGKYVNLDLSTCTMTGTLFDIGSASTGKALIVSLTLPDVAISFKKFGSTIVPYRVEDFSSLKSIYGKHIKTIAQYALYDCKSLTSVSFPEATEVNYFSFGSCTNLTSVDMPALTKINGHGFSECASLTSIDFTELAELKGVDFDNCTKLASVNLPKVANLGAQDFFNCTSLTSVSLPEATKIGNQIFSKCTNLTSVSLTKLTGNLPYRAFAESPKLTSLQLPETPPNLQQEPFTDTKDNAGTTLTILVPKGKVAAYTSAWGVSADTAAGSNTAKYGDNHKRIVITDTP
jgi:hypothetical protein